MSHCLLTGLKVQEAIYNPRTLDTVLIQYERVSGTVLDGYVQHMRSCRHSIRQTSLSSKHTFTELAQFLQDLHTAPACHQVFAIVLKKRLLIASG